MGWNNDYTILTGPISLADIGRAAGYSHGKDGDDIFDGGWLFVNGLFNMWAKHKGFKSSSPGYAYDKTQATPELRSPLRVAAALAANFGMNIPIFNANDFKTHYADPWIWDRPTQGAPNERFRPMDFDGYVIGYWQIGPVTINNVQSDYETIFAGSLSTPRTPDIYPGDLMTFSIRCCDDPDSGMPGMLYPYAFLREQASIYDLSKYYMGIAMLDAQNKLWIITGDRMDAHHTQDDVDAYMSVRVPNTIVAGAVKIIPVLVSAQYPTWDDAPGQGNFVNLHGAFLSRNIGSASSKLTVSVAITYSNGEITMVWTLTNNTSNSVNLSNLYAFIMSAESYYNEGDAAHNPPIVSGYGVTDYIDEHWPAAAPYTPPDTHMGLSNPPDIYLSDWATGIPSPSYLAARGYNAYVDFRAANNNSSVIPIGGVVTWTKVINIGQDDGFGYYADGIFVAACMYVYPNAYTEIFSNL